MFTVTDSSVCNKLPFRLLENVRNQPIYKIYLSLCYILSFWWHFLFIISSMSAQVLMCDSLHAFCSWEDQKPLIRHCTSGKKLLFSVKWLEFPLCEWKRLTGFLRENINSDTLFYKSLIFPRKELICNCTSVSLFNLNKVSDVMWYSERSFTHPADNKQHLHSSRVMCLTTWWM